MKRSSSSLSQRKGDYMSLMNFEGNDDKTDDTKRKSRNLSEKKRRDQFNMLINELCSMVSTNNRKMDKSTVLRSTITFLENHSNVNVQSETAEVQENWKPSFLSNEEFTHLMLEALDGFIIVFSVTGRILYMSESVTSLLGYMPNDLSSSIYEVIHESDKPSLYKLLNSAPNASDISHLDSFNDNCVSIMVHMKHGPIYSSESPTYELVRLMGTFHQWNNSQTSNDASSMCTDYDSNSCSSACSPGTGEWRSYFVAMARFQNPQLLREMTVSDGSKQEFTSRHSLEWKFLFLDHRAPPIIGYLPFEVLGTSGYDYFHIDDLDKISACHEALMQTGEGTSCFYRFLTKGQQWIWIQTRYFITYHQWNSKPEFIVCTHSVVSYEDVQASIIKEKKIKVSDEGTIKINCPPHINNNNSMLISNQSSSHCSKSSVSSKYSAISSVSSSMRPSANSEQNQRLQTTVNRVKGVTRSSNSTPTEKRSTSTSRETNETNNNNNNNNTCQVVLPSPPIENSNMNATNLRLDNNNYIVEDPNNGNITQRTIQNAHQQLLATPNMMEIINPTIITNLAPPLQPQQDMGQHQNMMNPNERQNTNGGDLNNGANQSQVQEYLTRRRQLLQQQIMFQQEELRRVSEQLMLVQFVAPNLAVTTIPCQANGLGTMTIAANTGGNAALIQTGHAPLVSSAGPMGVGVQHPQLLAPQLVLQPQAIMAETMTASSIPKPTISTTTALIGQPGGIQVLPPTTHLMPLPLSQEQAQVVFAQGFNTPSQHSL